MHNHRFSRYDGQLTNRSCFSRLRNDSASVREETDEGYALSEHSTSKQSWSKKNAQLEARITRAQADVELELVAVLVEDFSPSLEDFSVLDSAFESDGVTFAPFPSLAPS